MTETSQRQVMSVTPESVIKLPIPPVEFDTTTGRPSAGSWPIVKLQTLLFLPYVNLQHYSLTVVVNPGLIANYYNGAKGNAEVPLYVFIILKT